MLWTTDEETGSRTSRALLETEARKSDAVLVLEPALPGGALKTRRKGCGEYEVVVHGVAAHAGVDPGKGVSAIRELARQVLVDRDAAGPDSRRLGQRRALSSGGHGPTSWQPKRAPWSTRARRRKRTRHESTPSCER